MLTAITDVFAQNNSLQSDAGPLPFYETTEGVKVYTAKKDDERILATDQQTTINLPLQKVIPYITNFTEKCNNEYASKRKFTDENYKCPYDNDNLIESKIITDLKKKAPPKRPNTMERYLVFRRGSNTITFQFYDLITIKKMDALKGKSRIKIIHDALTDNESKKYIDDPKENNTGFNEMKGIFTLSQLDKSKTKLEYYYISKTDHWFLNNGMILGSLAENTAVGTKKTMQSVIKGAQKETYKIKKQNKKTKTQ